MTTIEITYRRADGVCVNCGAGETDPAHGVSRCYLCNDTGDRACDVCGSAEDADHDGHLFTVVGGRPVCWFVIDSPAHLECLPEALEQADWERKRQEDDPSLQGQLDRNHARAARRRDVRQAAMRAAHERETVRP